LLSYKKILHFSTSFHNTWGARGAQWVSLLDLTTRTSLSPIRRGFAPSFVNYKKGCTRLATASDKDYQLLAQGRWFFPGTPASSTTKTGHHDIAEICVKHQNSNSFITTVIICYLYTSILFASPNQDQVKIPSTDQVKIPINWSGQDTHQLIRLKYPSTEIHVIKIT
jgi:hypothetical protein